MPRRTSPAWRAATRSAHGGLLALTLAAAAIARAEGPARAARGVAMRRDGALTIDGRLDEPAWSQAPIQGGFVQRFPRDAAAPSMPTRFAVLYDDDAIYVGIWADDPDPAAIRALLTRRDADAQVDALTVAFDSYHDHRTAYAFELSAAGVQRDKLIFDDAKEDDTWDAVWTASAAVLDTGWTAEFRIPLSQLRFSDGERQAWGLQVVRRVGRTGEQDTWSPWPRSSQQIVSNFGTLDNLVELGPHARLELLPYVIGGVDRAPVAPGDPLNAPYTWRRNLGLDLKYGLGPAFTLSATLNPDFGQIEADPSKINLSSNELFFADRRPFFTEGIDLFKLPLGNTENSVEAFYSRRIGAAPPAVAAPYDFIHAPPATTIYGAAKLTGKTADGWSVGVLDAVTSPEHAELAVASPDGGEPTRQDAAVTALTNYAIARVKRDLRDGATTLGASLTAVNRRLDEPGLAAALHDQAYTGGLQAAHRWWDNTWIAELNVIGSWVHGSPAAIALTQQSPVHYFQRPDADDVRLDPARTSLSGLALRWNLGQLGDSEHWRYGISGALRTAGLELNDAGFQTTSNRAIPVITVQYHDDRPTDHVLNYQVMADVYWLQTLAPQLLEYAAEVSATVQLVNYWSVTAYANADRGKWNLTALRGGPALRDDPSTAVSLGLDTDARRSMRLTVTAAGGHNWASGERDGAVTAGATVQARPNVELYAGLSLSARDDPMQYVATIGDDALAARTHRVVGRIHEMDAGLTARVNWTFSPHLTLQVYAQPFLASGRYDALKEVDQPRAARFADRTHELTSDELTLADGVYRATRGDAAFHFSRPDFDFRQLRSTAVLRWEYLPGSTLFVIWSHAQTDGGLDDGVLRPAADLRRLIAAPAEDIVMAKLTYWTGL